MKKISSNSYNFKYLRLSDVALLNPSISELPEKFYYIDLESVKSGLLNGPKFLDRKSAPSRAQRVVLSRDILYQTVRPYQKNNLFFDIKDSNYVASTGYTLLRAKTDSKFLYYVVSSETFVKRVLRMCVGSNYPAITTKDLAKILVPNPTVEEQGAIVSVLEAWDKYIELLDQNIQIKRSLKKYLMQVLLTGKLRISGQVEEWKSIKLKDKGTCIRGVSYKPKEDLLSSTGMNAYTLLRSTNVQNGELALEDIQIVRGEKVRESQALKQGDIIICMANGSKRLVGKSTQFSIDSNRFTVGAFMGIFRVTDTDYNNYINHLFNTNKYRYYINSLLTGSSINNLKPDDIESITFSIPSSLEEINRISSVLSKSDEEIQALEQKRTIIEQQRKYLLNNLVTGKIRLPKFINNK